MTNDSLNIKSQGEMEQGNGSLTATGYTVTYSYHKKDNVVTIRINFKPAANISIGTNTTTSDALPEFLRPVITVNSIYSVTNTGSGNDYLMQFIVNSNGKVGAFNFQSMTSSWSALWATFTYLTNN